MKGSYQVSNWIDCTGDVVTGDTIKFTEAVFGGSYRKPKYLGTREVVAAVVSDSYGSTKQQHTFTIEIIDSSGLDPLSAGTKTTRKGRNIYRNGTLRMEWANEANRNQEAVDKHARGDAARATRDARRAEYATY